MNYAQNPERYAAVEAVIEKLELHDRALLLVSLLDGTFEMPSDVDNSIFYHGEKLTDEVWLWVKNHEEDDAYNAGGLGSHGDSMVKDAARGFA